MNLMPLFAMGAAMLTGMPVQGLSCPARLEQEYLSSLRESSDPEEIVQAIECLGILGSIPAVNPLIDLLEFRRSFYWDGTGAVKPMLPHGRYPAGQALARIGKPSLPSLVKVLAQSEQDSVKGEVAFYALLSIFREQPEEGYSFLLKAALVEKSELGRETLLEVAKRYAAYRRLEEP